MDGRTLPGKIEQSPGGVGRNLADALGKLYRFPPIFLSAVGSDQYGNYLLDSLRHIDASGVMVNKKARTACYSALIDKSGEAKLGVGDMNIHSTITPDHVMKHKDIIENSPIIIMDGNISQDTMNYILKLGGQNSIPIWYEPTDLVKAVKPFNTDLWKSITCTSPNMYELISMAKAIGITTGVNDKIDDININTLLRQLVHSAIPLAEYIPIIMVTLGRRGLLMISRAKYDEPVKNNFKTLSGELFFRYYPAVPLPKLINVMGAGDCTAAGFISGVLQGFTEPECVNLGARAAHQALNSSMAIPKKFEIHTTLRLNTEFINILI